MYFMAQIYLTKYVFLNYKTWTILIDSGKKHVKIY